jgi:hypothetical protein
MNRADLDRATIAQMFDGRIASDSDTRHERLSPLRSRMRYERERSFPPALDLDQART